MSIHEIETISITRFRIGEHTLDWTQAAKGSPCFLRSNHPGAESRSRWVGHFTIPAGWIDGSDPKATAVWARVAGFETNTAVCLNCAKRLVQDLATAMNDYDRRQETANGSFTSSSTGQLL